MSKMPEAQITAIFALAAEATDWRRTHEGLQARVGHDGFTWQVIVPKSGPAFIGGSTGYGGDTCEYIEATPVESISIVEAARSATRVL